MSPRVIAPNTRPLGARDRAGPARFGRGVRACRRSTAGGWAGRGGSPRLHPASPRPSRPGAPPARSADHATFLSCVVRLRTRDPVFGPLPVGPQAVHGPADAFLPQTPRGHAWFLAHLGGEGERPEACGLARAARGLRQDRLERLTLEGGAGRHRPLGPRRLFGQACQAGGIKGMEAIAHGLHAAAHQRRQRLGRQPAGTRQHTVGTPPAAGMGGAPIRFSLPAFLIGQGADLERWLHKRGHSLSVKGRTIVKMPS